MRESTGTPIYVRTSTYPRTPTRLQVAGIVAAVVLLCVVGIHQARSSSDPTFQESDDQTSFSRSVALEDVSDTSQASYSFELSPQTLDSISGDAAISSFVLGLDAESVAMFADGYVPSLAEDQQASLEAAIADIEDQGAVGFVFFDTETGKGFAYNADEEIYGASSFKAPYMLYLCETLIDSGELSRDDLCQVPWSAASYTSSVFAGRSYSVSDLIEVAIIDSDNSAFGALREAYDSDAFDEWVCALGADEAVCDQETWYPTYSARSSAQLWTEMYTYVQSESETAAWLSDLLGQTTTSFIRDALGDDGAYVRDKAGWISDYNPSTNAVCDAGIVSLDGRNYVMSLMCGIPDSEENRTRVSSLAQTLFDLRDTLA